MSNPYYVSGPAIAQMMDRKRLFDDLCAELTKATPSHVSVVGCKLAGKTVLLHALAEHFARASKHYVAAVFWDLRRETPNSDDSFRRQLADRLRAALEPVDAGLAADLKLKEKDDPTILGDLISLVLETLQSQQKCVLVVMDGFDYLKLGTELSANLLDQMRAFAQLGSLRIVTGSRQRLRELCKTNESRTSDFWRIFRDPPFELLPFADVDWDPFLEPFAHRSITLDKSARTELSNWTGGVPILAAAVAAYVYDAHKDGTVLTKKEVDEAAAQILRDRASILDELWDDCGQELQGDLAILSNGDVPAAQIPPKRIRDLERRGFLKRAGAQLRMQCRMIQEHCRDRMTQARDITRLFGTQQGYEENVRGLLELRLEHVPNLDEQLKSNILFAIREVCSNPLHSLNSSRLIIEAAMDVIWAVELPERGSLPAEWKKAWQDRNQQFPDGLDPLPSERGQQCFLLKIIAGRDPKGPKLSKHASRKTSVLIDQMTDFGNYANHRGQEACTYGIASLMCFTAIELCVSLAHDFHAVTVRVAADSGRIVP